MATDFNVPSVSSLCKEVKADVGDTMDSYTDKYADSQVPEAPVDRETKEKERLENAQTVIESFYNLVTDFYEYGWGQSFHFAPIYDDKTFPECIAEYERDVGKMLGAKPGMKLLVSKIIICNSSKD